MKILGYKLNPEYVDKASGEVKQNYVLYVEDLTSNGYGVVTKSISADRKIIDTNNIDLKALIDDEKDVFISTSTYKYQEYMTDIFVPN